MERNEKIINQAKEIMDNFVQALSQAKVSSDDFGVNREIQTREPNAQTGSTQFREKIFKNAKNHTNEHIVAETKKW